jgi:hypothetical protein
MSLFHESKFLVHGYVSGMTAFEIAWFTAFCVELRRERVSIRCLGVNDLRTCGSARMSGIVGMDMIGPYGSQPLPSSTQNSVQGGVK